MSKQTPASTLPGMVRCENCGEDYSSTYKRCPFCDERLSKTQHKRRGDGPVGYGRNPLQLIGLIASFTLIVVALFIVFNKVAPLLMPEGNQPETINPGTTQNEPSRPTTPDQPEDPTGTQTPSAGTETPEPNVPSVEQPVTIQAISLNKTEFTLPYGDTFDLKAAISPANSTATITWSSNDEAALTVDANGTVVNKNTSGSTKVVTVTASCGGMTATCKVYCRSGAATQNPSQNTQITGKTEGKITANGGLNIRSGPGSSYDIIAAASYGATVVILEDTGTGWYKIDYGNGKTGYASSTYIQPK